MKPFITKNGAKVREAFEMLERFRTPLSRDKQLLLGQRVHLYDTRNQGRTPRWNSAGSPLSCRLMRSISRRRSNAISSSSIRAMPAYDEYADRTEAVLSVGNAQHQASAPCAAHETSAARAWAKLETEPSLRK